MIQRGGDVSKRVSYGESRTRNPVGAEEQMEKSGDAQERHMATPSTARGTCTVGRTVQESLWNCPLPPQIPAVLIPLQVVPTSPIQAHIPHIPLSELRAAVLVSGCLWVMITIGMHFADSLTAINDDMPQVLKTHIVCQ
jgi:hypothetical protein